MATEDISLTKDQVIVTFLDLLFSLETSHNFQQDLPTLLLLQQFWDEKDGSVLLDETCAPGCADSILLSVP